MNQKSREEMDTDFILLSAFLTIWFGFFSYMAWLRPETFRDWSEKSLFIYGNSDFMKQWVNSLAFLWLARIGSLLAAGIFSFVVIMSAFF
jgi:hypothetical protein